MRATPSVAVTADDSRAAVIFLPNAREYEPVTPICVDSER
jgi:hypothetical protein